MRFVRLIFLAGIVFAIGAFCRASDHSSSSPFRDHPAQNKSAASAVPQDCLTPAQASKHVGKKGCVLGKVVRVEEGSNGVTFLDFCADYRSCPFTVVVFRSDLQALGDVRQLQGRTIVIQGRIEEYDDRAEIVLSHPQQLGDGASHLTVLPKDYDVERQGHYSAGSFRPSKAKKPKRTTLGPPISLEDPEVP